jgi:hypothetical protein
MSATTSQRAYKPKKSLKSPSVQARVLQKRANGASKAQIARELGIAVNTTTSILELNDFDRTLQSEQAESLKLIPLARKAVLARLNKDDGAIGIKVLENTIWPINQKQSGAPTIELSNAVNIMFKQAQSAESSAAPIERQSVADDKTIESAKASDVQEAPASESKTSPPPAARESSDK